MLENKDKVKECLRNVIDLDKLFKYDESDIISLLNEIGEIADVDAAFKKAAENGYAEVIEMLLKDKRVNPAVNNDRVIEFAVRNGHVKVVKMLEEAIQKSK